MAEVRALHADGAVDTRARRAGRDARQPGAVGPRLRVQAAAAAESHGDGPRVGQPRARALFAGAEIAAQLGQAVRGEVRQTLAGERLQVSHRAGEGAPAGELLSQEAQALRAVHDQHGPGGKIHELAVRLLRRQQLVLGVARPSAAGADVLRLAALDIAGEGPGLLLAVIF